MSIRRLRTLLQMDGARIKAVHHGDDRQPALMMPIGAHGSATKRQRHSGIAATL